MQFGEGRTALVLTMLSLGSEADGGVRSAHYFDSMLLLVGGAFALARRARSADFSQSRACRVFAGGRISNPSNSFRKRG
jgi:hypothetical protein